MGGVFGIALLVGKWGLAVNELEKGIIGIALLLLLGRDWAEDSTVEDKSDSFRVFRSLVDLISPEVSGDGSC